MEPFMRKTLTLILLTFAASPAHASVVKGVDFRDAFGGILGLASVLFFMRLCFKGDANPPAKGFITDKRLERELRGDGPNAGSAEIEAD
jgi:hypothetical protein